MQVNENHFFFFSTNTVDGFLTIVCLDTGECMLTLEGSNKKNKKIHASNVPTHSRSHRFSTVAAF